MSASSRFFQPQAITFAKLKHWMQHYPVASNSFLCLNLWIAGDVLAQYSEHKRLHNDNDHDPHTKKEQHSLKGTTTNEKTTTPVPLDYTRTVQCASYGALVTGPLMAVWYPYMDRLCNQYKVTARFGVWGAPILKVLADEFIMSPPMLCVFYGYMNVCEGGSLEAYEQKLRSEFLRSWLTSMATWPVVLLGTFRFLPVHAQTPFISVFCIVWDAFLSHRNAAVKHNDKLRKQQPNAEDEGEEKEPTLMVKAAAPSSSQVVPVTTMVR